MLKNDIEKTLQAHSPVPPEGFAERMDRKVISLMQQKEQAPVKKKSRYRKPVIALAAALVLCFVTAASRDLIIRPDTIRARETATPLVTALSEGKGEETDAGTETLSANALKMFETNFPGIAGELKPVNLSVEKQGIRMEVISALEKGNEAWIVYSLQDLEGDRVTRMATSDVGIDGIDDGAGFYCYLDCDEAEHKSTAVYYTGRFNSNLSEADSFPFSVEDVGACRQTELDLLPYLKEYGKASEGVKIPDDAFISTSSKVLDYTEPLNVSLGKGFCLTGIGWIDNQLHVQIREPRQERITISSMTIPPMDHTVGARFVEGPEKAVTTERAIWGSAGDGYQDMSEHIFDIRPEDADKIELKAWIFEITEVVKDTWEVQIPLADILLTAEEPAAREEETEMIREIMDAHVEEVAYDELTPIGLSTEKQGIRMEVVSGCRKGDNAYFLLTTQELNGEYSDYSCDPPHDLQTEDGTVYGHYIRLGINRTENTTTWLYCVDLSKAPLAENNALRVGIEELDFKEEREVDLLPLLELDGRTEEGITLPENYPVFTIDGKRAEDGLKVLNDEGSLDIHLDGNTYLSAIGWIGDQLHVQLVEKNEKSPDPGYENLRLFVNCSVTGKPYEEIRVDGSPVSWFNLQNETSREEYIFNCTPEDVDSMRLYGYGTIMRATLRDDWTVEVPLDLLPDLTAAETAEREEEADVSFCLKRFFSGWAAGNTVYVGNALTFHTEPDHPDEHEAAKEIMASGTPRGVKLHSISGTKNDPVRTLDVTVQWDAEDGGYRYTRYALELWMQKDRNGDIEYEINPEGFKNGSAAEAIPDADLTLVTEAQMIREIMDAHVEEGAYDELTPIGLSTEKQGFRMEMVSGCRKGDYVYFLLNMLDLEGKYSGYDCYPVFEEIATEDKGSFGYCAMLRNNQAKNKTTWLYRKNLSQTIPADNNTVRAGFTQFYFSKHNSYDLLPMLKEYGRTEEGVTPPDSTGYTVGDGKRSEDKLYVLNYEKSLDIHLGGNVFLSAIGWIGNQLHVQFQEKPWSMMTEYPDVPQDNYRMTANCNVQEKPSEETTVYGSPMIWTDPDEGTSREEYVFNCTPEDLDRMELYAFETQSAGNLQADWTVEVPLDLLPDLTAGAETAEPAA